MAKMGQWVWGFGLIKWGRLNCFRFRAEGQDTSLLTLVSSVTDSCQLLRAVTCSLRPMWGRFAR